MPIRVFPMPSKVSRLGYVYRRIELPVDVRNLALEHAGVITRAQLAGLPEGSIRRLRRDWVRLGDGLYCLTEPNWLSAAWAGLLRVGPDAALGGVAAAFIDGMTNVPPSVISVWVAPDRSLRPFRVSEWTVRFKRGERRSRGLPPRTLVEDTVVDAAREADENSVVALAARAISMGKTTRERLGRRVDEPVHLPHRVELRAMCRDRIEGIESILEWRYLQRVERAHGLPVPERQYRPGSGSRIDALYRGYGVAIELDGRSVHDDASDWRRDNRHLLLHGIATLRYTWDEVMYQPCSVAAEIADVLTGRGWVGDLRPCTKCA